MFTALAVLCASQCEIAEPATPAQSAASHLQLLVLGSGGPAALGRAASSYVALLDGEPRVLIDAGPGSFARFGEAHLSADALDIVLLTHLHVDHAAELPGFVKARAVSAGKRIHFDVFGPSGQAARADAASFPSTQQFIDLLFGTGGAFSYLKDFAAPVNFNVRDIPTSGAGSEKLRTLVAQPELRITAVAGHHGDAPAVIYRIDSRGQSVVFSGDIDAQGLPALEMMARGARLLVFDAVVLDPPGSPQVLYSLHTPPDAIGALAQRAQVGTLLLSHLSPAVESHRAEVQASIAKHYRGEILFATDGLRLTPQG